MAPAGLQSGDIVPVGGSQTSLSRHRAYIYLALIVIGAAVWRLPLLLRADRFFTSDEAIVGLMARHVLEGDLPVFFWGQRYMGTIESFLAAGVFSIAGDSVLALKLVPLLVFLAFLLAHYDLASLLCGSEAALLSVLLLAVGTPVLYSWSARAMAGYMETLLLGTLLLSTIVRYERAPSRRLLFAAGVVGGLGWWTSQLVACFVLAGAVWLVRGRIRRVRIPSWTEVRSWITLSPIVSSLPVALRALLVSMNVLAAVYLGLGALVLLTGGGELKWGPLYAKATDGWKLAGYAGCWVIVETVFLAMLVRRETALAALRRYGPVAVGFVMGYAPALYGWLKLGSSSAQLQKFSLPELLARLPVFFSDIIPLVAGGSLPDGLGPSWMTTAVLLGLLLPVIAATVRDKAAALPALTAASTIALLLFSGNFSDLNSYRYLLPICAPMSILYARGIGRFKPAALRVGLVSALLLIWGLQDHRYVGTLDPDFDTGRIVQWLRSRSVESGYADYWIAYRLDFISKEDPLLAPYKSQDRYPRYTEKARSAGVAAYVFHVGDPIWPRFTRAKRLLIREQALIGRHRVYLVSQR
ncbi:MAG: glycosyltransferase family 39 protein [Acidobacteriota bacterium]